MSARWSQKIAAKQQSKLDEDENMYYFANDGVSCDCIFKILKMIWKRANHYKGIYLTTIIHFSDVITDYLIFVQYALFALDENLYNSPKSNINYLWVSIAAFSILIANRILGCYFIWLSFTPFVFFFVLIDLFWCFVFCFCIRISPSICFCDFDGCF